MTARNEPRPPRTMEPRFRWLAWLTVIAVVIEAGGEAAIRAAERSHLGGRGRPGHTVVLVLGNRNRSGRINRLNRWRVQAALATTADLSADLVIFNGGSPGGAVEAELLAEDAIAHGLRTDHVLEPHSTTTVENLQFSLPHLRDATRIAIVSDPLHAERARRELWRREPTLAELLVPAQAPRPGWWPVLLPLLGYYEALVRLRLRQLAWQEKRRDR